MKTAQSVSMNHASTLNASLNQEKNKYSQDRVNNQNHAHFNRLLMLQNNKA